ncbi:L,D-transpeptidase [Asaia sp. VD9]|uniref:L,D-transpeptidase n=1 Tax=Asaia sp. VD9 TaxID=3081235 RepID=UPI003016DC9B
MQNRYRASSSGMMTPIGRALQGALLSCLVSATALSGCAQAQNLNVPPLPSSISGGPTTSGAVSSVPDHAATPPIVIPPLPVLTEAQARVEASRLTLLMKKSVSRFTTYTPEQRQRFIRLARAAIASSNTPIDRPQLLMVVDRNPKVQRLCYVLAMPGAAEWETLGGTPVSTGKAGRKFYYITPTGVFINSPDRLGYRALGTKNENGIRGIGAKGMRVWDMGWHTAVKGWRPDHETGDIRLEIHATDPDFLEQRLGHPASEGCIRIPATMNVFMDKNGLLDAQYEQAASYDGRFRALLPKDRTPTPIAGDALVVVDSAETVQAISSASVGHQPLLNHHEG